MTSDDAGPILVRGTATTNTRIFRPCNRIVAIYVQRQVGAARAMLPACGPSCSMAVLEPRAIGAPLSVLGGNDAGEPEGYGPSGVQLNAGRSIFAAIRPRFAPLRGSAGRAL